jgi:hypothetical protein
VACSGNPWSFAQKAAALTRGPHQSALHHISFLRQEFVDMIRKGQWNLLPARLVLDDLQLRLSPLGVVPQRDRRLRTISDYSFFGINHETLALSPAECMQFGKALWRVLRHLKSANPHLVPVYLSKIYIADIFYRVWVGANDVPKLGVLFPSADGEEYLIGFPLALPMGWTESPKIFTAATETVADLVNNSLAAGTTFGPHPLEVLSEAPPPHLSRWIPLRPPQRRLRAVSLGPHPYLAATSPRAPSIAARPSSYGTFMSAIFWEWCRAGLEPAVESNVPSCTRWTRYFAPSTAKTLPTARNRLPPKKWRTATRPGPRRKLSWAG